MNLTPEFWTYVKVVLLVATVPAIVGFVIVLAERRIMGFMQVRLGPNRVGPAGDAPGRWPTWSSSSRRKTSRRRRPRRPCTSWRRSWR